MIQAIDDVQLSVDNARIRHRAITILRSCFTFAEWTEGNMDIDLQLHLEILFSDESHFCLNGYAILKDDNLQAIVKTPLHSKKNSKFGAFYAPVKSHHIYVIINNDFKNVKFTASVGRH